MADDSVSANAYQPHQESIAQRKNAIEDTFKMETDGLDRSSETYKLRKGDRDLAMAAIKPDEQRAVPYESPVAEPAKGTRKR